MKCNTRCLRSLACAALALAAWPSSSAAQSADSTATLRMRVTDAATGAPIAAAQVGFPELGLFQLTNGAGVVRIERIPAGERALEVSMFGYGTASAIVLLEPRGYAIGDVALELEPIAIEEIEVFGTARIQRLEDAGFYTRPKFTAGRQLGPLEIADMLATVPSDLFRGMPGVQRIPTTYGMAEITSQRACGSITNRNQRLGIWLDGVPYFDALDHLPVDMIEAVEVYIGANVPMQFTTPLTAACGVILLWSK